MLAPSSRTTSPSRRSSEAMHEKPIDFSPRLPRRAMHPPRRFSSTRRSKTRCVLGRLIRRADLERRRGGVGSRAWRRIDHSAADGLEVTLRLARIAVDVEPDEQRTVIVSVFRGEVRHPRCGRVERPVLLAAETAVEEEML